MFFKIVKGKDNRTTFIYNVFRNGRTVHSA